MTYFDYSATTKVNEEVLKITKEGLFTKLKEKELENYKNRIKEILNAPHDVIFTSGSSESNNYIIKGILQNKEKNEIITSHLEHSSVKETLKYLEQKGCTIKYVNIKNKELDLNELKSLITSKTALITICAVNSETGLINEVDKIGKIAKENNIPFHCDMTQSMGKVDLPLNNIDLISASSHKIYGPKGIGIILKNKDMSLKPLIYGDRNYSLGLIKGFIKALELSQANLKENYKKTEDLNSYLKDKLKSLPTIIINEGKKNIPHILNFSILNYKPETFLHYLEMNDIYISTKSACASGNYSEAVLDLTKDKLLSQSSVRISLSHHNTKKEIDELINLIKRSKHGR